MSQQPEEHWRVMTTTVKGKRALQGSHFKSEADAQAYIKKHEAFIFPGEQVEIIRDFDTRIYPFWKPNHGI